MRLISFFALSLALHAAALAYPVTFGGGSQTEVIRVRILATEPATGGGVGNRRGGGMPARRAIAKSLPRTPPVAKAQVESKPAPPAVPDEIAAVEFAVVHDTEVAVISATTALSDNDSASSDVDASNSFGFDGGTGATGVGGTGNGFGSSGAGLGRGSGVGLGSTGTGGRQTLARYRHTPRPDYPDSARRESHEGRVLLRVLVDDQGRSRRVEIKHSSGSGALDHAAAEAVKGWRFHPARSDDQPVESWVNIPVDFRLTDRKN